MRAVAALPACSLIAGAALGLSLPDPHPLLFGASLVGAWLALCVAWWEGWSNAFTVSVAAIFFAGGAVLGGIAWQRAWRPPLRAAFDEAAARSDPFFILEGTLRADATVTNTGVSLSIDVDSCLSCPSRLSRPSGVLLTVVGDLARERIDDWRAGRRVRVPATLRRPSVYLDPDVPDNERALARRGTSLVGTVKSGALVEVLARGSWIDEALGATRAYSRRAIARAVGRWDPQAAGIVVAIVIGDRAGLDADVQRKLQEAGTYHVIAISGGNIAILAGLMLGAFRTAGWFGRSGLLMAIALLTAYARLVGGGASVDRATLMAAIYLVGRVADQRSPPLNTLAVAAALIVAADPLAVADPAFVLTFGATLAILIAVPLTMVHHEGTTEHEGRETHENAKRTKSCPGFESFVLSCVSWSKRRAIRFVLPMLTASIATEAVLFPVGAFVFSRVTFAGLGLNFFAIPLMALAQVAGMAVVPLALVSAAAAACAGWAAAVGASGLVWSADLVRFVPAVTYRTAPPTAIAIGVYYAALTVWWSTRSRARVPTVTTDHHEGTKEHDGHETGLSKTLLVPLRVSSWLRERTSRPKERTAAAVALLAAAWILVDPRAIAARRGDGRLHVTFIDVGQGDGAFVRLPTGSTLLVDAGGLSFSSTFDVGDRVVAPVVRGAGFFRLDYLALTHGDPDHIGGAPSIVREFRPHEVWEGIPVPRVEALTRLRVAAQGAGARWANVYAGDHLEVEGVEIVARHPHPADWERQRVRNDDSLVIELRWRDVSILLAGDVGQTVERSIADAIPPAPLRVVKVAHHGSRTSSAEAFVNAVRPQVAVVSVGRANRFGHPAAEVLERYRSVGAEVFRTDQDGAVTVDTDGEMLSVSTFTGRRLDIRETHESTKGTK